MAVRAGGAAAANAAVRIVHRSVDAAVLKDVFEKTHVVRTPASASIAGWFGAVLAAFFRWLADIPGLSEGLFETAQWLAIAVLAIVGTLLVLSLFRRLRLGRGPRGPSVPSLSWTEVPEEASSGDRLEWRRRLEERLARGDVAGALEALWWWIAFSLAPGSEIDESWTTRELLEAARRPDLRRLGAALDVLLYGRRSPSRQDVAECLARFEERLA